MNNPLDRLQIDNALLLVVDVQGKLARLMFQSDSVIKQLSILIEACRMLDVPILWAEQLPDKLGPTVPELADKLEGLSPFVKSSFGCCDDARIDQAIETTGRRQILLGGIETHVCVWQTAAALLSKEYEVHLICDAATSRSELNREVGFKRMATAGVHLSNVEMALFELLGNACHPKFRDVTKLLK